MKLISHRGNLDGPRIDLENSPEYINNALSHGYDVEIDVRFINGFFYLGHDRAEHKIEKNFLQTEGLWCHAKNIEALEELRKLNCVYFWHENDDYTLTSNGFIWAYPGKKLTKNSICVLPEKVEYSEINCAGICSDFIKKYK
mgnify:FL=1|tara:strand:- start:189 stop:614 length:426 start_codon:yes stop_codon:yes gene_type:complete